MTDDLDQMVLEEATRQSSDHQEQQQENNNSGADGQANNAAAAAGSEEQQQQQESNTDGEASQEQGNQEQQQSGQAAAASATNNNADSIFSERLGLISGGKFKDEAALKEILSSHELIKQELFELKGKNPYANEFEKKRNEMLLAGATKESLKAFEEINELGDLTKLSDRDVKINKLVLVDGYSKKMAEIKVDKEFPIESSYDDDKEFLETELKQSAKADLKALEQFKIDSETVTPAQESNLMSEAAKAELVTNLKPHLVDLTSKASNLTSLNLNGKEGDEAIKLDVALSADDKVQLASDVENFMVNNNLPLTQENYDQAVGFARERLMISKFQESNQKTWAKAEAHFTKFFTEKYENPGGKPNGGTKPGAGTTSNADALKKWEDEMIS